jgi:LysM repeat protein
LSPLLLAGVGIVLVAAALFFLPSLLIGLGGDGDTEPTPSASGATASATPVVSPSPSPAPTPFVYVVKEGDTLSSIAVEFEVPLDDLIAANRATLPDPDKLGIGDELIIPIGGYEPSPSAVPEEPSPSP